MTSLSPETAMIKSQLLTGHVLDAAILQAMERTPRAPFLPDALKGAACVDEDLEVAPGRHQMEPLVFARLLHLAEVKPTDRVLVVGCLSGYSVCVLAPLAEQVIGVEDARDMAERARQHVRSHNIHNAEIFTACLMSGYQVAAPYDVVLIEGAVQQIPQTLLDQLADGGRLVTVESQRTRPGSASGIGKALIVQKRNGATFRRTEFDASVSLLPGFEQKPRFEF